MNFLRKVKTMLSNDTAPKAESTGDITLALTPRPGIIDVSSQSGYLNGQLLVATPVIESGPFHKSVIYIFNHSADGAMGLVINQPIELLNYQSLFEGMNLPADATPKEIPVFFGGPVERGRGFILHTSDYFRDFSLSRSSELAVTASSAILKDMVATTGPKKAALVVGYAGWGAGQLEHEIEQNSWINVPATEQLVFDTDNDLKWVTASKSLGIDMAFYSTAVGHA